MKLYGSLLHYYFFKIKILKNKKMNRDYINSMDQILIKL